MNENFDEEPSSSTASSARLSHDRSVAFCSFSFRTVSDWRRFSQDEIFQHIFDIETIILFYSRKEKKRFHQRRTLRLSAAHRQYHCTSENPPQFMQSSSRCMCAFIRHVSFTSDSSIQSLQVSEWTVVWWGILFSCSLVTTGTSVSLLPPRTDSFEITMRDEPALIFSAMFFLLSLSYREYRVKDNTCFETESDVTQLSLSMEVRQETRGRPTIRLDTRDTLSLILSSVVVNEIFYRCLASRYSPLISIDIGSTLHALISLFSVFNYFLRYEINLPQINRPFVGAGLTGTGEEVMFVSTWYSSGLFDFLLMLFFKSVRTGSALLHHLLPLPSFCSSNWIELPWRWTLHRLTVYFSFSLKRRKTWQTSVCRRVGVSISLTSKRRMGLNTSSSRIMINAKNHSNETTLERISMNSSCLREKPISNLSDVLNSVDRLFAIDRFNQK